MNTAIKRKSSKKPKVAISFLNLSPPTFFEQKVSASASVSLQKVYVYMSSIIRKKNFEMRVFILQYLSCRAIIYYIEL